MRIFSCIAASNGFLGISVKNIVKLVGFYENFTNFASRFETYTAKLKKYCSYGRQILVNGVDDRLKVVLAEIAEKNGCHIDTKVYRKSKV